jgi:hypothetical protein
MLEAMRMFGETQPTDNLLEAKNSALGEHK